MIKNTNKAIIFDIQRGSFVDGPGMRTVIFFKGCNLNCKWCHNPEGICKNKQMLFYADKCTKCGACEKACKFNLKQCVLCGECEKVCPNEARKISGREYSIQELEQIVLKDEIFYSTTGGGVTLSGGECMLNADFIKQFLVFLKSKGIHIAIDTAGNVAFSEFDKVIDYVDLFLYDVKLISSNLHKEYTGVDNKLIKENLKKLVGLNKQIIIRVPIIPTVNDNVEEMKKISNFLSDIGFDGKVELLPYHTMGEEKSKALGKEFYKFETPSNDTLALLNKQFQK